MTLKLNFLGAADTVTGSRTLLTYNGRRWLIDCGLFQGPKAVKERNRQRLDPDASTLAGVILTHAHLDHSGYLPRLCGEGFAGQILATAGTRDLCEILLRDAAKLEEETAAYANKTKHSRHDPALPLFTTADAERALSRFAAQPRHAWIPLAPGLKLRFLRAGHIIGASLVQFAVDTAAGERLLTFSGDLGNDRSYLLKSPEQLTQTHALVIESTYGDREQPRTSGLEALGDAVKRAVDRGGVVVIPAFAVGRAQEVIYMLRLLEERGKIPAVPVVLDSPMANAATEVCLRHPEDHVLDMTSAGTETPLTPRLFEISATVDDSMAACMRDGPLIVISASGMLNGGRVLHHLKSRLGDPKNMLIFTGYQAEGTKGRYLQEQGAKTGTVRIHHAEVAVEAEIVTLDHLSSHADRQDILAYLERMQHLPERLYVNHGSPDAQAALAAAIRERFKIDALPIATLGREDVDLW